MSMAVESPLPSRVDLATWDAVVGLREDAYELVEGVPTMTPSESTYNRVIGGELVIALRSVREHGWRVGTDVELTVLELPVATVRRPDVVVLTREAALRQAPAGGPRRVTAGEVAMVAEIVSPTSVERDLVTKRREYAQAGVPAYLVVDLRSPEGELTLYAERDSEGRYVDIAPAQQVTISIGDLRIDVRAADLSP